MRAKSLDLLLIEDLLINLESYRLLRNAPGYLKIHIKSIYIYNLLSRDKILSEQNPAVEEKEGEKLGFYYFVSFRNSVSSRAIKFSIVHIVETSSRFYSKFALRYSFWT